MHNVKMKARKLQKRKNTETVGIIKKNRLVDIKKKNEVIPNDTDEFE